MTRIQLFSLTMARAVLTEQSQATARPLKLNAMGLMWDLSFGISMHLVFGAIIVHPYANKVNPNPMSNRHSSIHTRVNCVATLTRQRETPHKMRVKWCGAMARSFL